MARRSPDSPAARWPERMKRQRGHNFYPPLGELRKFPKLYATTKKDVNPDDHIVQAHFFGGSTDFYLVEYDPSENRAFGWMCLGGDTQNAEWGYSLLHEIEAAGYVQRVRTPSGHFEVRLPIERDCYWTPKRAAECRMPGYESNPVTERERARVAEVATKAEASIAPSNAAAPGRVEEGPVKMRRLAVNADDEISRSEEGPDVTPEFRPSGNRRYERVDEPLIKAAKDSGKLVVIPVGSDPVREPKEREPDPAPEPGPEAKVEAAANPEHPRDSRAKQPAPEESPTSEALNIREEYPVQPPSPADKQREIVRGLVDAGRLLVIPVGFGPASAPSTSRNPSETSRPSADVAVSSQEEEWTLIPADPSPARGRGATKSPKSAIDPESNVDNPVESERAADKGVIEIAAFSEKFPVVRQKGRKAPTQDQGLF